MDLLPEIAVAPRLPTLDRLIPDSLKRVVDAYLRTRQPRSALQVGGLSDAPACSPCPWILASSCSWSGSRQEV